MSVETGSRPWEELSQIAAEGDADRLDQFLETLSGGEVARALSRLSAEEASRVLVTLGPVDAAELIEEISDAQAVELVEHLPAGEAAAIVVELPSDEQANLIAALPEEGAEAILTQMEPEAASDARRLALYPSDVAGGLMVTEYVAYPDTVLIRDVVDDLRQRADTYSDYDVQYVYVVGSGGRLEGVLPLRGVVLSPGSRAVADRMIRDPISVRDDMPLDELADVFERNGFLGVPVVDADHKLVGVVRRDAVEQAYGERSDRDYLSSQGIVGGEELRSMSTLRRSTRRLSWLSINIVLNVAAASVIAMNQETVSAVIALAVFLPIVSDMSGCSGNQAVAVSIRELALGLVTPFELRRVLGKELAVGLLNGLALGTLIGVAAWLWKGNPYLGLVVGAALAANTLVAVAIGGIIPLFLRRFGFDPALASGPILTTVTDACGFFLLLGLAGQVLPKLM